MIWRLLTKGLIGLAGMLPAAWREKLAGRLIEKEAKALAPDKALRYLFGLEALMYSLEGPLAVQYGNGVHPKHRHTTYHDFFVQRVRKGERVIDIGCGIGAVASDLAARSGATVDGLDISEENIAEARKRYSGEGLNFKVGDALALDDSVSYDTVVLSNVLEHIENRPEFLRRVQEQTKAKRFLIRVPLFERDWRVPLKRELGIEWRLDLDHKTEHTIAAFEKETGDAGLSIKHLETRWGEIWAELYSEKN